MKKILTLILVSLLFHATVNAQEEKKEHQHTGFYLSMGLGPAFGKVDNIKRAGGAFDFKIGAAVKENLILHATLLSNAVFYQPKGTSFNTSNEILISEAVFGGGFTYYYFMPENLFISASIGSGAFAIQDQNTKVSATSNQGLAFQVKTGQEWWVSKRWALGVAVAYNHTSVDVLANERLSNNLKSNRFSLMFNATFN